MRVDSHVHGMHADRNEEGKLAPPIRTLWEPGTMTPEEYVAGSRERGVDRVLSLDPPHVSFELHDIFGDYIIPGPQVDMDHATPEEIDALFSQGAAAIKFISPAKSYGDDSYFPLYDVIQSHHALAVFHTGWMAVGMFEPGGLMRRTHVTDVSHMRPMALDRVARVFPDLKILMAHFGNPWWEEAKTVIRGFPNVYADLSGGTAFKRPLEMWRELFTRDGELDVNAIEKLCFGTDVAACLAGQYPFVPCMEFYERLYDYLNVPLEIRKRIDRENILSLIR